MSEKYFDCAFCNSMQSAHIVYGVSDTGDSGFFVTCSVCGESIQPAPSEFMAKAIWEHLNDYVRAVKKGGKA